MARCCVLAAYLVLTATAPSEAAPPPRDLPANAAFPVQRLADTPAPVLQEEGAMTPASVPAGASFPEGTIIGLPVIAMPEAPSSALPDRQDEVLRWVIGSDVLFDFDKDVLRPEGEAELARFLPKLQVLGDAAITIEGHTDAIGSHQYNQDLSRRRAKTVAAWLRAAAPEVGEPVISAFGESRPAVPNTKPDGSDDPEGRRLNRRVELVVRSRGSG
jgi:outer membrane protein OmpA-like peptidoglycan-associated protein